MSSLRVSTVFVALIWECFILQAEFPECNGVSFLERVSVTEILVNYLNDKGVITQEEEEHLLIVS